MHPLKLQDNMNTEKIQFILDKCWESNPRIGRCRHSLSRCGDVSCSNKKHYFRPELSDLLLAVGDARFGINSFGHMVMVPDYEHRHEGNKNFLYDLTKSLTQNLEENTELVDFVYELLK